MLVLVSVVADLALLNASYETWPDIKPMHANGITAAGSTGLVVLAVLWRFVLLRRPLSITALYRIDMVIAAGIGTFVAAGAYFAWDLRPASYSAAVLAYGLVFTRALVVPSSGKRTAWTTALVWIPLQIASVGLVYKTEQEIPSPMFVGGSFAFAVVAIVLATVGSQIIYGLRRQVSEARQLGQYTLDRKIGAGGMGVVYRAHHAFLRRPTAVKLLSTEKVGTPDTLDRFEREVQHMSQLTHPNTVAVFDYGRGDDGALYYAMEYLDGIDLEHLVQRYGAQPADRVMAIVEQVCGALTEAHGKGLTHRDIKPANIILCERGGMPDVAKVVDFGLVKEIAASSSASQQVILGTPYYIAPELVNEPSLVGTPADVYALGATAYFLLTGKRVFEGKTAVDICVQHVTAKPVPPTQHVATVPAELEALVLRCLAKTPDQRPSAPELAKLVRALARAGDWSEDEARAWWKQFHATATAAPDFNAPTRTITINLDDR